MKRTRIAAIDVGTTKVCTVVADVDGNGAHRILGVGMAPSQGLEKGVVYSVKDATASISQSVKRAEEMAGLRIKSAYIGVSATGMSSINNHATVTMSRADQLVRQDDLQRVLHIVQSVGVPTDRQILHIIPRSYTLDGQGNIKNPVGMHGFRLDLEAHIVSMAGMWIQNLTMCVKHLGISVDSLVLAPLASAEAVLTEDEKLDGVMLVDIGGATTDIAVYKEGSVLSTYTLAVGGQHITNDIVSGMGIAFEVAEGLKKKYGNVTPVSEDDKGNDVTVSEGGRDISYYDLCEIIRARVGELLQLVLFKMPGSDYAKTIPAGMVLTGGTANLPGIAELGCQITRLPIRIGTPLGLETGNEVLNDPACATAVGLLYWKTRSVDAHNGVAVNVQGVSLSGFRSLFNNNKEKVATLR